MKGLTMPAVALAALPLFAPLFAEEQEKKPAAAPAAQTSTAAQPAAAASQDSPLVAAARRSNRLGKKPANVITNETLSKASTSSARITTTLNQPALNVNLPAVPAPTPEMAAAEKAKERRAKELAEEKAKAAAEARQERRAAAAAYRSEEGMYDELEDPDYGEGERDVQRTQPEQKPPQL